MAPVDMAEERTSFVAFVEVSQPADWAQRPRLSYRPGLEERRRDALFDAFEARWGRWYGDVGDRHDIDALAHALGQVASGDARSESTTARSTSFEVR